jgi:hypothetical protein
MGIVEWAQQRIGFWGNSISTEDEIASPQEELDLVDSRVEFVRVDYGGRMGRVILTGDGKVILNEPQLIQLMDYEIASGMQPSYFEAYGDNSGLYIVGSRGSNIQNGA